MGCDAFPRTLYKNFDSCTVRYSFWELNLDECSNSFLKGEMALVLCVTRWLRHK